MKLNDQERHDIAYKFIALCGIDNPSGGEEKVVDFIRNFLTPLGIDIQVDDWNNVFFHVAGTGEPIFLNAHMDSVQPCSDKTILFDGNIFSSSGDTVLGADDLAGVMSILYTVLLLKKYNIPHKPLDIIFTTFEEVGGKGIKAFDMSQLRAFHGIVVDSKEKVGTIILESPSKCNFTLSAKGVAEHSSRMRKGLSAITMISDLMLKLPLGKNDNDVIVNIGKMHGGHSLNTVPEIVTTEGEMRGQTQKVVDMIEMVKVVIASVQEHYSKGKFIFDYEILRESYEFDKQDPFIQEISEHIRDVGITPSYGKSFGASDANTFNNIGKKAILIGTGVKDLHTTKETITLDDIVNLTHILIACCQGDTDK